jgi:hypothetical protein
MLSSFVMLLLFEVLLPGLSLLLLVGRVLSGLLLVGRLALLDPPLSRVGLVSEAEEITSSSVWPCDGMASSNSVNNFMFLQCIFILHLSEGPKEAFLSSYIL